MHWLHVDQHDDENDSPQRKGHQRHVPLDDQHRRYQQHHGYDIHDRDEESRFEEVANILGLVELGDDPTRRCVLKIIHRQLEHFLDHVQCHPAVDSRDNHFRQQTAHESQDHFEDQQQHDDRQQDVQRGQGLVDDHSINDDPHDEGGRDGEHRADHGRQNDPIEELFFPPDLADQPKHRLDLAKQSLLRRAVRIAGRIDKPVCNVSRAPLKSLIGVRRPRRENSDRRLRPSARPPPPHRRRASGRASQRLADRRRRAADGQ